MVMRILHVSDFHFKEAEPYDAELVKSALLEHVRRKVAQGKGPIAIFVTGDIGNSGQAKELERASVFFDELLKAASLQRSALFVVPGNHDVNRRGLGGLARSLPDQQRADEVLGSGLPIPHVVMAQSAFVAWYNGYFAGIDVYPTTTSCTLPRLIESGGITLAVTGANSAIFSQDDHDHGKLWLGRRSVAGAIRAVAEVAADCRVLLMHHPLEWLHEAEQPTIRSQIMDGFDMICSGHLHETDYSDATGPSGHCLRIVAGAAYQAAPWPRRAHWLTFSSHDVCVEPIRFEETPTPVWTTDPSLFPHDPGHVRTLGLPVRHKALVVQQGTSIATSSESPIVNGSDIQDPDLFRTASGSQIYVEPRICDLPQVAVGDDAQGVTFWTLDDLASLRSNTVVHCPLEHGATQLARRLSERIAANGTEVRIEKAFAIPTYERKITEYFANVPPGTAKGTLILDDFVPSRDARMIKELQKSGLFGRFVALARSSPISAAAEVMPELEGAEVKELYLWGLDRQRVRHIAEKVFGTSPVEYISAAVEKTYTDLLGLAIPLTPANVIMYTYILWKESDFFPLDRVNIIERYTREVLSVPSDAFAGAFNVKNKMALAAAFTKELFDQGRTTFQMTDWADFCRKYSQRTLVNFDAESVFRVFEAARIFVGVGRTFHLRYGFLYSYFVALSVANRPAAMDDFIQRELFYSIPSVVEALSAVSTDNSVLLSQITTKLRGFSNQFYEEYLSESFDPLIAAHWPDADNEKEAIWDPINRTVSEGPIEPEKLDEVRSSLVAEARSLNQEVVLRKFSEMEEKLFSTITILEEALKNSDDVDGLLKVEALKALFDAYLIILQVGTLLSGVLATRRYFRWGGVVFFNINKDLDSLEELVGGFSPWVVPALNKTLVQSAMERLASKKLGSLFVAYSQLQDLPEFEAMMTLGLLVQSKPPGWGASVERLIKSIDRRQYRLLMILRVLESDFKSGLSVHADREELKRLIALIETKRSTKSNSPGNRAVGKMLSILEQKKFFETMAKKVMGDMQGDKTVSLLESPDKPPPN